MLYKYACLYLQICSLHLDFNNPGWQPFLPFLGIGWECELQGFSKSGFQKSSPTIKTQVCDPNCLSLRNPSFGEGSRGEVGFGGEQWQSFWDPPCVLCEQQGCTVAEAMRLGLREPAVCFEPCPPAESSLPLSLWLFQTVFFIRKSLFCLHQLE